jgi:hypothetical protein
MSTASDQAPAAQGSLERGAADDRKHQAAALYDTGEWSERRLASRFNVARITVRHWLDELGVQRRTKAKAAWQRRDWAELRRSLLTEAGGCGSPTCSDPDCQVKPGACHRPGCTENAAIAVDTCNDRRWVRGYPTKYCSGACAAIDNRPHERFKLELERLRDEGLYDVETVASELDRAPQTVLRHVHLLGLGQWGAGFGQCFLSRKEIELLRERIIDDPRRPTWTDRKLRAVWQHHRHGDTSRYGALGGRQRGYEDDQIARVLELRGRGLSIRSIGRVVGLTKDQVARIVAAHKLSRNPL